MWTDSSLISENRKFAHQADNCEKAPSMISNHEPGSLIDCQDPDIFL